MDQGGGMFLVERSAEDSPAAERIHSEALTLNKLAHKLPVLMVYVVSRIGCSMSRHAWN